MQVSVIAALEVHKLSCSAAHGIFQTKDRTHVPSMSKQILSHCTAREALDISFTTIKEKTWLHVYRRVREMGCVIK